MASPELTLREIFLAEAYEDEAKRLRGRIAELEERALPAGKFRLGDRVRKRHGASWQGLIVGTYSTKLTKIGYAVESERESGSVQIYPEAALEHVKDDEKGSDR